MRLKYGKIGSSSSGKTTLAKKLSIKLNIEHKELDYFFWEADWKESSLKDFRDRVDPFTKQDKWIVDENFSRVNDLVWARATDIIWLDYPLNIILKQFVIRSISRTLNQELLWHNNKESFWNSMLSPNSLLLWILKTYKKRKKKYEHQISSKEFPDVRYHRLRNPKETEDFLNKLK